ncbi:MAG: glycosyltransferase family 4 protein [Candidatus Limnocylindrales bacterium]
MSSGARHVVILDENLPVPLDRRVWLTAQTLAEAGYQVTVIAPRGKGDMGRLVEHRDGIRLLRYPQRAASGLAGYLIEYPPSFAFTAAWLLALRIRGPVDILHGCNPPDLFFLLARVARLWGARYVYDQHDANPELATTKWGDRRLGRLLVRLTTAFERASYHAAAAVIVPNDSYANLALTRGGRAPEDVAVVPNAPPAGGFRELAGATTPSADGQFRIGYLGVMGSQDGVEILVDAIAALRADRPGIDVRLDLVGDGEARPALERRAADAGLGDRVVFHGYRAAEEFVPILARADVCVSPDPPTPFNDISTMTKVVEYLAIGRPVVAFDLAETRRLVGSGGTIVAEPTAAALAAELARLADDRVALGRLTDAAGGRFAQLDLGWEHSAERLLAVYDRVAKGSSA